MSKWFGALCHAGPYPLASTHPTRTSRSARCSPASASTPCRRTDRRGYPGLYRLLVVLVPSALLGPYIMVFGALYGPCGNVHSYTFPSFVVPHSLSLLCVSTVRDTNQVRLRKSCVFPNLRARRHPRAAYNMHTDRYTACWGPYVGGHHNVREVPSERRRDAAGVGRVPGVLRAIRGAWQIMPARRVIKRVLNPRSLSHKPSHDTAISCRFRYIASHAKR